MEVESILLLHLHQGRCARFRRVAAAEHGAPREWGAAVTYNASLRKATAQKTRMRGDKGGVDPMYNAGGVVKSETRE